MKNFAFSLLIGIGAVLTVMMVPLLGHAQVCGASFIKLDSQVDGLQTYPYGKRFAAKDLRYSSRKHRFSSEPSVFVEGRIADKIGRSLFIFRKTGSEWASNYTPAPDNFQGDPRWFPILFGGRTASFFGFEKLDENRMTAPTAETLNQAIDKINQKLQKNGQELIGMRFHEAGEAAEEGPLFLQRLVEEMSLPVAKDGHYAVHDLAYHAISILLPDVVLEGVRKRARIFEDLRVRVSNDRSLDPAVKKILEKSISKSIEDLVRYIDYGTGNVGFVLAMEKGNQIQGPSSRPYQAYDLGETVIHHLVDRAQRLLEEFQEDTMSMYNKEIGHVWADEEAVAEYLPMDLSQTARKKRVAQIETSLKKELRRLLATERSAIRSARQEVSVESLVNFVRARISAIQEFAR